MITASKSWLKDHAAAIIATILAVQNWHFFGARFDAVLESVATLLQAVGNS